MLKQYYKPALALLGVSIVLVFALRAASPESLDPSGNNAQVPALTASMQDIAFTHTDDNADEDIIITSDKKTYEGISGINAYFSVDVLKRQDENIGMQFYFSDTSAKVGKLYQRKGDAWLPLSLSDGQITQQEFPNAFARKKEIDGGVSIHSNTAFNSSGEKEYFMAEITYTPGSAGQFLVEAFGNKGSYGILDPWYGPGVVVRGGGATYATPTLVQTSSTYMSGSTATMTVNVTAGNLLWVGINNYNGGSPGNMTVSGGGNTWSIANTDTTTGDTNVPQETVTFYAIAARTTSITITCNRISSGGSGRCILFEYSGINTSSPLDGHSEAAIGTSVSYNSGNITTTHAKDLLIGYMANRCSPITWSGLSGTSQYTNDTDFGVLVEDQIVNSVGTYNATATASTACKGIANVAAFKAATIPAAKIRGGVKFR